MDDLEGRNVQELVAGEGCHLAEAVVDLDKPSVHGEFGGADGGTFKEGAEFFLAGAQRVEGVFTFADVLGKDDDAADLAGIAPPRADFPAKPLDGSIGQE